MTRVAMVQRNGKDIGVEGPRCADIIQRANATQQTPGCLYNRQPWGPQNEALDSARQAYNTSTSRNGAGKTGWKMSRTRWSNSTMEAAGEPMAVRDW